MVHSLESVTIEEIDSDVGWLLFAIAAHVSRRNVETYVNLATVGGVIGLFFPQGR